MAAVEPVEKTVRKGEILIRQGQVVTEEDIKTLKALNLLGPGISFESMLGLIIVLALIMLGNGLYLHHYQKSLLKDESTMIFSFPDPPDDGHPFPLNGFPAGAGASIFNSCSFGFNIDCSASEFSGSSVFNPLPGNTGHIDSWRRVFSFSCPYHGELCRDI